MRRGVLPAQGTPAPTPASARRRRAVPLPRSGHNRLGTGHHNPGQDCQNGCHNHGFYLSGTLYSSANGGQPVVGAAITFIDATGDMRSGSNGNFWWTLPVTFPVTLIRLR